MKFVLFVFGILLLVPVTAEENSLDWDIDSIFDETTADKEFENSAAGVPVLDSVLRRGVIFDASYEFQAGVAPGYEEEFSWAPGVKMLVNFGLDARISDVFRVRTAFHFQIPNFEFYPDDFFFDYNVYDVVFFRGGKYDLSWGISPNYGFTNLLSRVASESDSGESYIVKADIPLGAGGFQILSLTRADLIHGAEISRNDFGYGGKYNLALRWADFNLAVYYKNGMPLRSFLSVKSTLWNTEVYSEGLVAVETEASANSAVGTVGGAFNLGFARDLFDNKFSVNGELFFNEEGNTLWFRRKTSIREAGTPPFIEGFNLALNLFYRFNGKGSPRLFVQTRYAPLQNSAQLVPGLRLSPLSHVDIYLAVPMALGSKDGYYYSHTEDPQNRPFSVMLFVTLKGDVRAAHFF